MGELPFGHLTHAQRYDRGVKQKKIDELSEAAHTGELASWCRAAGHSRRSFGQREAGRRSQTRLDWPEGSSSCVEK